MPTSKLLRAAAAAVLALCSAEGDAAGEAPPPSNAISIGIIDSFNYDTSQDTVKATLVELRRRLPDLDFSVKQIASIDPVKAFRDDPADFVITSCGTFLELAYEGLASHVATRKTAYADDPSASEGAAFVVLNKRRDITRLADLRGAKVVASQPNSFESWLSALYEIKTSGYDPEKFFGNVSFTHFLFPDAFSFLTSGSADAAVLSTCLLEQLDSEGVIDKRNFRVINSKPEGGLRCARSTELFPGVVFGAREDLDPALVWRVTSALLTMPETKHYGWTIAKRFSRVADVQRELAAGPYAYLRDWTPAGIWKRWSTQIIAVLSIIAILVLNSLYLRVLVRRRTRQLQKALIRQSRLEKKARKSRERLSGLERLGVISMMSGMLAHELQQPLLAINNYLSGLRVYLGKKNRSDQVSDKSLDHIAVNCDRISQIVQRVRGYAKSKRGELQPCDLADIAARALVVLRDGQYRNVPTTYEKKTASALVLGQPLELELLVINLMRNACSAALDGKDPRVTLRLDDADEGHWRVTVADNGPPLDDKQFERLTSLGESLKPDGMGIGLSLVRGIVDGHGATLRFRRLEGRGISAEFLIDKLEQAND